MLFRKKPKEPGGKRPGAPASLSRLQDRRLFTSVLITCALMIALATGFSVYRLAFNTQREKPTPGIDLTSLRLQGRQPPPQPQVDAANPCIMVQEHLERLREADYVAAYGYLCTGLKDLTPLTDFVNNARRNAALFRDVAAYRFGSYTSSGTAGSVDGYIDYVGGGRSRVQVQVSRQADGWRIAFMTVIYQ